ncbi:hypothetical protein AK812_SmicGene21531 [Symbiodinium microadriaticum]|uniref:EF-hand domain-containing protein n=1 Tax=Symbiodinium microadriaticum TaxID=2951 RepID=A0A1Q9DM45_SYMMI|nr:hypothetical protein AK812_SmicGene21531 [Symbiodinium microadriaticum]
MEAFCVDRELHSARRALRPLYQSANHAELPVESRSGPSVDFHEFLVWAPDSVRRWVRSVVFSSKLSQILLEAGGQGGVAPGQLLSFDDAVRVLRNIRPGSTGNQTKQEIKEFEVFKLFDSDNSGKMDVTEMVDVRAPEWTGGGQRFFATAKVDVPGLQQYARDNTGHGSSLESTSSSASSLNRAWQRTLAPKRLWADTVDTPSQSLSQSLPQSLSQSHQSLSQSTPSPPRLRRGEPISAELVEEELVPFQTARHKTLLLSHVCRIAFPMDFPNDLSLSVRNHVVLSEDAAASSAAASAGHRSEEPCDTSEDAGAASGAPSSVTANPSQDDEADTWQNQKRKRLEVIRQMKESDMYRAFNAARPRSVRRASEPWTPDPKEVMGKTQWEHKFYWFKRSMRLWWEKNQALENPTVLSESQGGASSSSDVVELD